MSKKPRPSKTSSTKASKNASKKASNKTSKNKPHKLSKGQRPKPKAPKRAATGVRQDAEAALIGVFQHFRRPQNSDATLYDVLNVVMSSVRDPFGTLASTMAFTEDHRLSENAMRLLFLAADDDGMPQSVRDLVRQTAIAPLNAALRDPSVADERKNLIGPLLTLLGAEVPTDEYIACFEDYDAALETNRNLLLEGLSDDLEGIDGFAAAVKLDEFAGASSSEGDNLKAAYAAAAVLCQDGRDLGAWASALIVAFAQEHDLVDARAEQLLELASTVGTPAAAWALKALGTLPGGGEAGEHALGLARRMIEGGIAPRPLEIGQFSRALVSQVDGDGTRSLFVCVDPDGKEEAAAVFLFNDVLGLKDAFWLLEDIDGTLDELASRGDGISYERCTIEHARELVADTLALHEPIGRPLPGRAIVCLNFLGAPFIEAHAREPRLDAYALPSTAEDADRSEDADLMMRSSLYSDMTFTSDEGYAFVSGMGAGEDPDSTAFTDGDVRRFLDCVPALERSQLAARIGVNLEFEAMAGRAGDPANRAAERTRRDLLDANRPLTEMPFALEIAARSLPMIAGNLFCGCRNQREANERAMELDG